MPLVDNAWYYTYGDGSTTGYYAVTAWATGATIAAGAVRRQSATPSVGNERCFVCVVAGTTHATTEPTWTVTRGAKNTDNTVTWQECTGIAALNGDLTNTPNWTTVKNTAIVLGQVIQRNNAASYQICTTAGTAGNGAEPGFSDTAGTTTADNTVTWTSLGVVGNFTGWQAPHARLSNAFASTWGQAGNTFYVGSNSSETRSTTMTLTSPGTAALPCRVLCVDVAGSKPPVAADLKTTPTATIATTGASTITIGGYVSYCCGIIFSWGAGGANNCFLTGSGAHSWFWDGCQLFVATTQSNANAGIAPGGMAFASQESQWTLNNTTVKFSATSGQFIGMKNAGNTKFNWQNTPNAIDTSVAAPANIFGADGSNAGGGVINIHGVDLSAMASKTIILTPQSSRFIINDCKFGASTTVSQTPVGISATVDVINSDSTSSNTRTERYHFSGTQTMEPTIVRTGGASLAWKIVTNANSSVQVPFISMPLAIWNPTTGSAVTVTVYGIWGGGSVPNNNDIWTEIEYLGTASYPQSKFCSTGLATVLTAAAGQGTDASTWGGSTTAFKMSIALPSNPTYAGYVYVTVKAAKVSTTFYVDPLIVLS